MTYITSYKIEMKVNKMQFAKIKLQFDILKMKAAYIEAERKLLDEAEPKHDDQWEMFYQSDTMKPISRMDKILALEELGRQALEREDYLEVAAIYKQWKKLNRQL